MLEIDIKEVLANDYGGMSLILSLILNFYTQEQAMFTNAITIGNWSWSLTAKVFTKCLFVFKNDLEKET